MRYVYRRKYFQCDYFGGKNIWLSFRNPNSLPPYTCKEIVYTFVIFTSSRWMWSEGKNIAWEVVTNSGHQVWRFLKACTRNAFVSYTALQRHVARDVASLWKAYRDAASLVCMCDGITSLPSDVRLASVYKLRHTESINTVQQMLIKIKLDENHNWLNSKPL